MVSSTFSHVVHSVKSLANFHLSITFNLNRSVNQVYFSLKGSYRTGTSSHTCGCVFVGGNWAITAGHCGGSGSFSMEFGGSNRGSGTVFGVSAVTRVCLLKYFIKNQI